MLPLVTHSETHVAFVSTAQAITASTSSDPTPRPRKGGATHIETSSTMGDEDSSRYPPTRPTRSSSTCARNVARSLPRDPAAARCAHSASGRFASAPYVEPNAEGDSSSAESRTCRKRAPSRGETRRTFIPTASCARCAGASEMSSSRAHGRETLTTLTWFPARGRGVMSDLSWFRAQPGGGRRGDGGHAAGTRNGPGRTPGRCNAS